MRLIAATNRGIFFATNVGYDWRLEHSALSGQEITTVIAREGVILAGSRQGILRSQDHGGSWEAANVGLDIPYVRFLAYHPQLSDYEYAGTEPAAIFYSVDGARTWQACPDVEAMRERYSWRLPYSPQAGCVRGFAFYGKRAYAAVEVGGVLRSDDIGATWELVPGSSGNALREPAEGKVHSDVHSIAVHSASADHVIAPTGGGLFVSHDGARSWRNLYHCYCRAVWLDPNDARHMIFGPADGVDRSGRIEESRDGGATWQSMPNVPGTPWPRHMVERFIAQNDQLFAILSNGDLLCSVIGEWRWKYILSEVGHVNGVAFMRH